MVSERGRKALAEVREVISGFCALPVVPLDKVQKLKQVEQTILQKEGHDPERRE